MNSFRLLEPRERAGLALFTAVASASVAAAVLGVFADDGRTPWFKADTLLAAQLVRCEAMPADSRRHDCLREVAALADAPSGQAVAAAHPVK